MRDSCARDDSNNLTSMRGADEPQTVVMPALGIPDRKVKKGRSATKQREIKR